MSNEVLPNLPRSHRLSDLLGGDNHGFLVNAYLALQRQWPDRGGYDHYLYVLSTGQMQRPDVLREIASSPVARRQGTELIDDLESVEPQPDSSDRRYLQQCVNLRLPYLAQAVNALRDSKHAEQLKAEVARLLQRVEEQDRQIAAMRRELRNLSARLAATGVATPTTASVQSNLATEVEQLKATVGPLHHFATVDLKRMLADYVNALLAAHMDAQAQG